MATQTTQTTRRLAAAAIATAALLAIAARQQHERAADERCGGDAIRDEVGLPDRALVQHVADEHHVADDNDGERDEPRGDVAAQHRHTAHRARDAVERTGRPRA